MNEPRISSQLEEFEGEPTGDFYADVLYELAGKLGVMNDFYMPLVDVSKLLRGWKVSDATNPNLVTMTDEKYQELEQLRTALTDILEHCDDGNMPQESWEAMKETARKALMRP